MSLDEENDKTTIGWGYINKVGSTWKYWDTSAKEGDRWKPLPRSIDSYTVNNIFFVKSGSDFVGRDNPAHKWPEAFAEPPQLEAKKKAWLENIHKVWGGAFALHRDGCQSGSSDCCRWKLRVKVEWSDKPGDKTVYAVWAAGWERSNAKDWFLTESRVGVAAHECGHLLGAYDEYTGGAVDPGTNKVEDDSIMGAKLTRGYPRHLDGMRDEIAKLINTQVSRSWSFEVKDV